MSASPPRDPPNTSKPDFRPVGQIPATEDFAHLVRVKERERIVALLRGWSAQRRAAYDERDSDDERLNEASALKRAADLIEVDQGRWDRWSLPLP